MSAALMAQERAADGRPAWREALRLRYAWRMWKSCAATCAVALLLCACTDDEITVGSQCPTPQSGRAKLADPDAGPALVYGTSCAPCDPDDIELDARGCPVLVTWESCGGDICIGRELLRRPVPDAGPDEDAGGDEDGGDADGGGSR